MVFGRSRLRGDVGGLKGRLGGGFGLSFVGAVDEGEGLGGRGYWGRGGGGGGGREGGA